MAEESEVTLRAIARYHVGVDKLSAITTAFTKRPTVCRRDITDAHAAPIFLAPHHIRGACLQGIAKEAEVVFGNGEWLFKLVLENYP